MTPCVSGATMSLDRFVHLLATETLWLAPLSSMEDKREGKWIDVQASKFQDQVQGDYGLCSSADSDF